MPSNYTQNYQLSQWGAADQVKRTDFNADNAKIDAAIAAVDAKATSKADASVMAQKCEIATDTYVGDGADSRDIYLGRRPKAVFVCSNEGIITSNRCHFGGLALYGSPIVYQTTNHPALTVTDTGFTVYVFRDYSTGVYINESGTTFHYIAFF